MKLNQKIALASATVFSAMPFVATHADDITEKWTPRSVDEIKADITQTGNQQTYTVRYGDTLSSIAEALNVDINVLANLNNIANLDLIFPDTVLKTQVNAKNEVTSVEITTPAESNEQAPTTAKADLTTNEVQVDGKTVAVQDLTKPVEQTPQPVPTVPQTPEGQENPVAPAVEPTSSTVQPQQKQTSETKEIQPALTELLAVADKKQEEPTISQPLVQTLVEEIPEEKEVLATLEPKKELPTEAKKEETAVVAQAKEVTEEVVTQAPQAPAPEVAAPTTTDQTYTAPAPQTSPDFATLAAQNAANAGLQPKAAAFKEEIAAKFGTSNIGGYRAGDDDGQGTGHGAGLAIDVMVPVSSELGDAVAQYAIDNMDRADISYIIWKQQFYSPLNNYYGEANTWADMPDRGGITANHYDHVHISFNK